MLVGLIADIHGNLPALDAVLADLERERVDRILCLGDVAIGPQPVETLERLEQLGCPVIMGNWDAYFVGERAIFDPEIDDELARVLEALGEWAKAQLEAEHRRYLHTFRETLELDLDNGLHLLAFHGSPRSNAESILATTSDDELERMLDGRNASVLVSGHTHFQLVRRVGDAILLNPGSIGLAFRRSQPGVKQIAPWAEYGLVATADGRLSVELRRTAYDVEGFLRAIAASGMPNAEWWIELWSEETSAGAAQRAAPTS